MKNFIALELYSGYASVIYTYEGPNSPHDRNNESER